jgi:hypothetical protein
MQGQNLAKTLIFVHSFLFEEKQTHESSCGGTIVLFWCSHHFLAGPDVNRLNEPKRRQGRPSKRPDDNLENFAFHYSRVSWATPARVRPEWQVLEHVYVQFCSNVTHEPLYSLLGSKPLGRAKERTNEPMNTFAHIVAVLHSCPLHGPTISCH